MVWFVTVSVRELVRTQNVDVKEQLMMNLESDILQGEPMDICKINQCVEIYYQLACTHVLKPN